MHRGAARAVLPAADVIGSSVKILYLMGSSRCGSTLLANILGELPGVFSAGELRFLWDRAREGRLCGCGRPVSTCDVWGHVLGQTDASTDEGLDRIRRWQRAVVRLHRTPGLLFGSNGMAGAALDRYRPLLLRTLDEIGSLTGCEVLVDSSKHPAQAAALLRSSHDVYLLHVVRDARAVTYSRLRWKANPDGVRTGGMGRTSIPKSVLHWSATNLASDLVRLHRRPPRSKLIRYEDLVSAPLAGVEAILDWIGERRDLSPTPFVDERSVALGENHTVSGNPDRFSRGRIDVRPDDRWIEEMSRGDRRATTALTAPLLLRYGYPIVRERVD